MNIRWLLYIAALAYSAIALGGCGKHSDRNVFGNASDDQLLSRCTTGRETTVALYINEGGGAGVGTSWSVTTEHKPVLVERQILYSDYQPAILSLACKPDGFDLTTSHGVLHFKDSDTAILRKAPKDLGNWQQG